MAKVMIAFIFSSFSVSEYFFAHLYQYSIYLVVNDSGWSNWNRCERCEINHLVIADESCLLRAKLNSVIKYFNKLIYKLVILIHY